MLQAMTSVSGNIVLQTMTSVSGNIVLQAMTSVTGHIGGLSTGCTMKVARATIPGNYPGKNYNQFSTGLSSTTMYIYIHRLHSYINELVWVYFSLNNFSFE